MHRQFFKLVFLCFVTIYISCQPKDDNLLDPGPKQTALNLISPANDSHFSFGDEISFQLEIKNNLSDILTVIWISSIDSIFGSERNFVYGELSLGSHSLTAQILFADSSQVDTSISITIHQRNENAIVKIIPPNIDSLWFYNTDSFLFSSIVTDSLGSRIAAESIQWISDHDGKVSTGQFLMTNQLSINRHHLILKVSFADETISTDSISNILIINDPWAHTDLLNDRSLESLEDPNAPFVRLEWVNWIKANSIPVRSLSSQDYSDLSFIDHLILNKNIVQMGEVAHGIAEQNRGRIRLIKYLHQHHKFSVIAFESGFYDCYKTNNDMATSSALESLKNSLYGMWHTTDLLDLYNYIKSSQQTDNPLYLCGFDIRPTGELCHTRPEFFKSIISKIDPAFAGTIANVDSILIQWLTDRVYVDSYIIHIPMSFTQFGHYPIVVELIMV